MIVLINSITITNIYISFLNVTFGECGRPKVAVQLDTFGHSREYARLSSLMVYVHNYFSNSNILKNYKEALCNRDLMPSLWVERVV